jgi:hypothetical protein
VPVVGDSERKGQIEHVVPPHCGSAPEVASGGAYVVAPGSDEEKWDIHFALRQDLTGKAPADQAALMHRVEQALTVIRGLYSDPSREKDLAADYKKLLSLAQGGLVGPRADPSTAELALRALENDIVAREAGRVKNRYLKSLGKVALPLGIVGLLVAWIGKLAPVFLAKTDWYVSPQLSYWGLLVSGFSAGTWVSFAARKTTLRFDELHIPESDRLEPWVRLGFVGIMTALVAVSFHLGAIRVTLGALDTASVFRDGWVAFLIGGLCGFGEQALSASVAAQSMKLLGQSANK